MSNAIEVRMVDAGGESHGEFEMELPTVNPGIAGPPIGGITTRFMSSPYTDNLFRVTVNVDYMGETA